VTLAFFVSSLLFINPVTIHAHPGRTDSSGGHTCRTNCASWGYGQGEYHYHSGGGSSGGSTGSTYTAPVEETSQPESNQWFMDYRNATLSKTPPTKIPTRVSTRIPTAKPIPTLTFTPVLIATPSPTSPPAPTKILRKKAKPVQVSSQPQREFFEWLVSFFRGK
jgi:hypothetical protein